MLASRRPTDAPDIPELAQASLALAIMGIVEYAVWVTHIDGRADSHSPRLVVTNGPLHFGDKLPLANVDCWITEVIDGQWSDDTGRVYQGRARASAGPLRDLH